MEIIYKICTKVDNVLLTKLHFYDKKIANTFMKNLKKQKNLNVIEVKDNEKK